MVGVTENPAHGEQIDPRVDHERRRRVAKIMYPEPIEPSRLAGGFPRVLDVREGLSGARIGQQPRALVEPGELPDQVQRRLRQGNVP